MNTPFIKTALLCLLPAVLLSGCVDEHPTCFGNQSLYRVPDTYTSKLPYFNEHATDTISFTDRNNDTVSICLQSIDTSWTTDALYGNPDCPDTEKSQVLQATYRLIKGNVKFNVQLEQKGLMTIRFNDLSFSRYIHDLGNPAASDYKESKTVNGKVYENIHYIKSNDWAGSAYASLSPEYGLIEIEQAGGGSFFSLLAAK
jgi:hypothetical protein